MSRIRRYDSVDVMRTIAIVLMVPCHFLLFLSSSKGPYGAWYVLGNDILGGLSAPLFLFLVGASQAISVAKQPACKRILDGTGRRMLQRGAVIFVFGLLFQIPIEGAPYEWDVLPFIGASLVVLCLLRRTPVWFLVACSVAVFTATPWLRGLVGYLHYWEPATSPAAYARGFPSVFMDPLTEYLKGTDPRLSVMATGFFVTGYFPFFPWMLFPIFGYAVGKATFTRANGMTWNAPLGVVGLTFTTVGSAVALYAQKHGTTNFQANFVNALSYFPPSPPWLLVQLGVCLSVMSACRLAFDVVQRQGWLANFCRLISRYSLTVYVLHYLLAYWPPRIAEILAHDKVAYIGNWISPPKAWLFAFVALGLFYPLFVFWDKAGGKYSMEWLIAQVARPQRDVPATDPTGGLRVRSADEPPPQRGELVPPEAAAEP